MDDLYLIGLELIHNLQDNYPQLEGFFKFFTSLGGEEFYLVVLPLVYWCIHKQFGKQLGLLFFIAVSINTIFKQALRSPRPFWLDPSVGLDDTAGYGAPSGHVQYATTVYLLIAAWLRRGWAWLLALLIVFTMALSRVYLGQHFVRDIIAGFALGVLLLAAFWLWRRFMGRRFEKRILGQRMMAALGLTVALGGIFIVVRQVIGEPNLTVPWAAFIPEAEIATMTEMATVFGSLLGFAIGVLLEGSRVRFRSDGPVLKRVLRYLLGIVVMVAIWRGLGVVFPREPLLLALPLRIFRYALITLWGAYYAPAVFVRLGLADADPEPGISFKL